MKCTSCGKNAHDRFTRCPNCGADLGNSTSAADSAGTEQPAPPAVPPVQTTQTILDSPANMPDSAAMPVNNAGQPSLSQAGTPAAPAATQAIPAADPAPATSPAPPPSAIPADGPLSEALSPAPETAVAAPQTETSAEPVYKEVTVGPPDKKKLIHTEPDTAQKEETAEKITASINRRKHNNTTPGYFLIFGGCILSLLYIEYFSSTFILSKYYWDQIPLSDLPVSTKIDIFTALPVYFIAIVVGIILVVCGYSLLKGNPKTGLTKTAFIFQIAIAAHFLVRWVYAIATYYVHAPDELYPLSIITSFLVEVVLILQTNTVLKNSKD